MNKINQLKWLMRILSLAMGSGFGLSHLFFPAAYFGFLSQTQFDPGDPFQIFLANMVGVVVIALCVGFWIAAQDPIKYRVVIIQFFVCAGLTIPVFFFHLVTGTLRGWEWLNLAALIAATWAVYALYPWKADKNS